MNKIMNPSWKQILSFKSDKLLLQITVQAIYLRMLHWRPRYSKILFIFEDELVYSYLEKKLVWVFWLIFSMSKINGSSVKLKIIVRSWELSDTVWSSFEWIIWSIYFEFLNLWNTKRMSKIWNDITFRKIIFIMIIKIIDVTFWLHFGYLVFRKFYSPPSPGGGGGVKFTEQPRTLLYELMVFLRDCRVFG